MMTFEHWFSNKYPGIAVSGATAVVSLVEEKATVPFIARYRKERTGNLDEVAIQTVIDAHESWTFILKRQSFIASEIERQQQLTDELKVKIFSCFDEKLLEDLYLPYKRKKKSKAQAAKEAGLQLLADWIWDVGHGVTQNASLLDEFVENFIKTLPTESGIQNAVGALEGAQAILVEKLSENVDLRRAIRSLWFAHGKICALKSEKAIEFSKFEKYFDYQESVASLQNPQHSHRYLALRRGWAEEQLSLSMKGDMADGTPLEDYGMLLFETAACSVEVDKVSSLLRKCAALALKVYVVPAIETEVYQHLKEVADLAAIDVFANNVKKLLLSAPLGSRNVLGLDPGIRTGCKMAVVNESGKFLSHSVFYLQTASEQENAKKLLYKACTEFFIEAIAIGNGTYSKETEKFIRSFLAETQLSILVAVISEAGASVYSASEVAREEFPDLDVTVRGAISIARRLQDPLAELVKVDPKSIGVGQYQHDVNARQLKKSLSHVVENCVNQVGINVNTASAHLLAYVAGVGPTLARNIVHYRSEKGLFRSRADLLKVPMLSKKAFEQAAGFLRVPQSMNPLDNTGVHPERYELLQDIAKEKHLELHQLMQSGVEHLKKDVKLRDKIGAFTFDDMVTELEKPGRDIREHFVAFEFRQDLHALQDVKLGMVCPGIVTNVTNFGVFVDIGVHQDGLVHISELADQFVKNPQDIVQPGDKVEVRILNVHVEKKQISLSMRKNIASRTEVPSPIKPAAKKDMSIKPKKQTVNPSFQTQAFAGLADWKSKK